MIRRLAHRILTGHWPQPWAIHIWDEQVAPAVGCRACIYDAVIRDIADQRRMGGGGW